MPILARHAVSLICSRLRKPVCNPGGPIIVSEPDRSAQADMQIDWMTPHVTGSTLRRLAFSATAVAVAVRLFVSLIRRWPRLERRQPDPVLLRTRGSIAPGPVSISGLKLRMRLIYDRGPMRAPRPVTLYAASGHRGMDGKVALDLLHAFCHTQHQPRTFRVDRIVAATDAHGTGIRDLSAWVLAVTNIH
jgi:hypothetical protein